MLPTKLSPRVCLAFPWLFFLSVRATRHPDTFPTLSFPHLRLPITYFVCCWPLPEPRKGFTISSHCLPWYSPSKLLPNATSRKRFAIGGLYVNSLLSTGASYLRKTATAFSWCHAPGLPERNLFVKARWVPALLTEMSSLSVFSSSQAPLVSGSSPAQAELGFSLGPQSHVCSQLSTSNTGDREARHLDVSREIERAKQTCFIPFGSLGLVSIF